MDVKTAFLNGDLVEDMHMTQPEGFESINSQKVRKQQRSIYGLKHASKRWNTRFDETIKKFDFIKNEDDLCMYKKVSGSIIIFLILYVDDILLIRNNIPLVQEVKEWLLGKFFIKDLGETAYIVKIKIFKDRSKRLLRLFQSTYTENVLK